MNIKVFSYCPTCNLEFLDDIHECDQAATHKKHDDDDENEKIWLMNINTNPMQNQHVQPPKQQQKTAKNNKSISYKAFQTLKRRNYKKQL